MNTIKKKINDIKKYTSPDFLKGVNKLYFLEVEEKPGMVKVGDTHRDVETRNDETILNLFVLLWPDQTLRD